MKTNSIFKLASERSMTLRRTIHEVLSIIGVRRRIYPVAIRKQFIPDRVIRQAVWLDKHLCRPNYSCRGPRGSLP